MLKYFRNSIILIPLNLNFLIHTFNKIPKKISHYYPSVTFIERNQFQRLLLLFGLLVDFFDSCILWTLPLLFSLVLLFTPASFKASTFQCKLFHDDHMADDFHSYYPKKKIFFSSIAIDACEILSKHSAIEEQNGNFVYAIHHVNHIRNNNANISCLTCICSFFWLLSLSFYISSPSKALWNEGFCVHEMVSWSDDSFPALDFLS